MPAVARLQIAGFVSMFSLVILQPLSAMFVTLTLLGLLYTVGLILVIGALWRAPEGFEDERGFHRGHEPRD